MKVEATARFKKDFKNIQKQGRSIQLLYDVVEKLKNGYILEEKFRDYQLVNSRSYIDVCECHIQPDWLLIYKIYPSEDMLKLIRTGSHSELF